VFGGLHLSGAAHEPSIEDTVRDIGSFGVRRFVPGHCTGYRAIHRLLETYGNRVIPGAVGQRHHLGKL
jgi:7,8-dihydropterin-6-yl-methyl-4-(beta-D-ribofuranosyl)aminobenzene 5'-phosphate synthase